MIAVGGLDGHTQNARSDQRSESAFPLSRRRKRDGSNSSPTRQTDSSWQDLLIPLIPLIPRWRGWMEVGS